MAYSNHEKSDLKDRIDIIKDINDELVKCRQQKLVLTKENFTCITREPIYWRLHGPNGG